MATRTHQYRLIVFDDAEGIENETLGAFHTTHVRDPF